MSNSKKWIITQLRMFCLKTHCVLRFKYGFAIYGINATSYKIMKLCRNGLTRENERAVMWSPVQDPVDSRQKCHLIHWGHKYSFCLGLVNGFYNFLPSFLSFFVLGPFIYYSDDLGTAPSATLPNVPTPLMFWLRDMMMMGPSGTRDCRTIPITALGGMLYWKWSPVN